MAWQVWFRTLKLGLRLLRISPDRVIWTFDDFYRGEEQSLSLLERFGFPNMAALYCPDLLGRSDARDALRNPDSLSAIGNAEELVTLSKRFAGLRIGLHSKVHQNYEQAKTVELDADICHCKAFHDDIFGRPAELFAFPYGRAHNDCIDDALQAFETVYLSDNRIPYTEQSCVGLVNRIHLELGGNLPKFFLKILLSRYRRRKTQSGR